MAVRKDHILFHPSWKAYFKVYLAGILLVPLLIGIFILIYVHKKRMSIYYMITDADISITENERGDTVKLLEIEHIIVEDEFLNIGTLVLETELGKFKLMGMEDPVQLKQLLEVAISQYRSTIQTKKQIRPSPHSSDPGVINNMDYLTGLWHQGLLSNEEFEEERRKMN